MSRADPGDRGPVEERPARPTEQSLLRGGIAGIAAVTLATLLLALAGALIALVVALIY